MTLPQTEDEVLLLYNPRCSKSRQVRAMLEERGIEFTERRYLEDPLDAEELLELAQRLGRPVQEWTRRKEKAFAESGLSEEADQGAWLEAVAEHPILLERPIIVRGKRAKVARPPEELLELL